MIIVARDAFDHHWYNSFLPFPHSKFALLWFSYNAVDIIGPAYMLCQSVKESTHYSKDV